MTRRLLASYVLLAAFILVLVELPLGLTYASRAQDRFLADVERDARVLSGLVEEQVEDGNSSSVVRAAQRYASQTDGRVVVTDASGRSVLDTSAVDGPSRDFSTRPEFATALEGTQASGLRLSDTLGAELAYVAVPIYSGSEISGALRISFPTDGLQRQVRDNWLRLGGLSILVLATAAAVGWFVARWATAPVGELEEGARRLATGDLTARAEVDRGPPELRQLAATFNDMAARVEVLVASQRAFVADASHQLRTPLTALRLRLESLEARRGEGEDATHEDATNDLDAVTAEVERLSELVEALLAIARSESRTATTTVDVATCARESVARWEPLAAEQGVRLRVDAPDGLVAHFVESGLEQVLDNLLDNAIGASPHDGTIEVRAWQDHPDTRVHLSVRDHGAGLSEANLRRAADRFWRGPDAPPGGTGLGLAICAELARASGGALELTGPADGGAGLQATVSFAAAP